MTEKRFRLGYVCGDYGLIDNEEWIDFHSMSENSEKNVQICINKMNELADENEMLKKELVEFKKWEKHIGDVKREDLDRIFKMSIYEIADAFEYYKKRVTDLERRLQE